MGGAPDPAPPFKGVRPNKSARPRNTAVTTAAAGKMRSQCLHFFPMFATHLFTTLILTPHHTTRVEHKNEEYHYNNGNDFHRKAKASGTI